MDIRLGFETMSFDRERWSKLESGRRKYGKKNLQNVLQPLSKNPTSSQRCMDFTRGSNYKFLSYNLWKKLEKN